MSEIEYTLIREKRKTVSIRIKADLSVEVKAPKAAPRELIDNFVQSKRGWIEKKKQELSESAAQSGKFNFSDGDELLLLGKTRSIASSPDNAASFDDERIYLPKADGEVRREIYRGYLKHLANIHFKARTAHFAKLMGVCPTAVKINFAKTRWGSCSGKDSINFSAYGMAFSESCIDCIVVHELSHILEKNHSKDFYAVMAKYLPEHEKYSEIIKKTGANAHIWDFK